jgi:hypothetical protein
MKRILGFFMLLNLIGAFSAFGEEGTKIKKFNTVPTFELATLKKEIDSQLRKIVGIRFAFRGKDIHHMKSNWYESSIWQKNPDGKGFIDVRVMVAKKDLPAFKAITTASNSTASLTVYGEVLRDSEASFAFVRLMGRNAVADPNGDATVSW